MKKTNKLISILIAVAMLLSMAPLSLTASAASEAIELRDYYTTKVDYSNSATQYYQYNNYLYKVAYSNLKNISEVAISHDSYDYLKLNFTDTGDTGWVAYLTTSYQGNTAKLSNLPTSSGKSVSFYTSNTVASNAKKPVVTVTCMAVNEPVWSWSDSSATAAFTSTDGKATMTVTAAIESSEQTAATCLGNDKTTYTATATANGKAYTNEKTVDGEQGPHSFEYSGDDVIGSCTNGCGYECPHENQTGVTCEICGAVLHTHSFTYFASGDTITAVCENTDGNCTDSEGTLTIFAPADLYADGTTAKEATVENNLADTSVAVSDITYSTADGSAPTTAGTYTASVTVEGATATVEFTLLNYAAKVTDKDGNELSGSPYKTFADAIEAAQGSEGSTLTLLDDVTLSETQYVFSGKFTLDLNGKTLINETGIVFYILEEVDLTIKDSGEGGTVQTNAETAQAIFSYGTLTVEDGFLKGAAGIYNVGTLNFKNGKIEAGIYEAISSFGMAYIYDGTFESSGSGAIAVSDGTAYIYGGEFSGTFGIINHGTAYIEGGEFKGNSYAALNLLGGTLEVTGGSFMGTDDEYGSFTGTPYGEFTVCYNEGATLILKGGEFPNGFVVDYTTANALLAEGYYYKDADGKLIDVADDAKIINGYVKVTKGADLSEAVITVDKTEFVYNGQHQAPAVTVTIGGKTLTENVDYVVNARRWENGVPVQWFYYVDAGVHNLVIDGLGDYTGKVEKEFVIKPATVDIIWEGDEFYYTGNPHKVTAKYVDVNGDEIPAAITQNETNTEIGKYIATATVEDSNYTVNGATINHAYEIKWYDGAPDATVSGTKGENGWYTSEVTVTAPEGYTISNAVDGTYGSEITFGNEENAVYYLKQTENGYIAKVELGEIKSDLADPAAEIAMAENKWNSFFNTVTFGYFFKETQSITITASDETSGIAKIEYVVAAEEITDFENVEWGEYTEKFNIEPNSKNIIYAKATDNAGRYVIVNTDGIVLYTDSQVTTADTLTYTLTTVEDVEYSVDFKGNTVAYVKINNDELNADEYEVTENSIIIKGEYVENLAADVVYEIVTGINPMGEIYADGDAPAEMKAYLAVEKITGSVIITNDISKVYDGTPVEAPQYETIGTGEVTIKYTSAIGEPQYTDVVPTEAGTYFVVVEIAETNKSTYDFGVAEFTISKADSVITAAPTPNTLTYNGEAHNLISAGEAMYGTMVYSLDGAEYSETIPQGTDAGDYTVYYKVAGDANHNDTVAETVTVEIKKKAVTVSATVPDRIYGDDYHADTSKVVITFDGIVEGDDVGYVVTDAWYHAHNVTNNAPVPVVYNVNGADAGNYKFPEFGDYLAPDYGVEATGRVLPRNIANAEITLGDALVYNGAEQTQTVAAVTVDGLEVTYTVSGNKATNVGVYALTITANTNFTGTKTVLYTINPDLSGIEGLDQYNVKSTNKADIEYVYNQLDNAVTDLASAEKEAEWNEIKDECWQWLKILESVAYRVESLGNSHLAYDIDTVTSADDEALASLEAEMYLFMRDYRDNMTEEELLKVDNARIEISELRDRIAETKSEYDRVIAAANGYDEATVTSADKDALVKLNDDIYALALTDNVTAEEKEKLQAAHDKVFGLIDKLVGISDEIKRITEKVDAYVFENVKSTDKADIQQLIADIKALLDTQNITADERAFLEGADETCDKLIAKIDETVAEINRINDATNAYDEATVTSADKVDIEKLLADIKALTDGDNITDAEREQLNGNEATLKALLDKIGATADEIARIETAVNGYDEETVKSTDKADLEQLKADIKALTDATNITEDERTKLGELDATVDSLIKKIDDTAKEIERIENAVNGYDEETVTSADVPELGKLIEDIKALTDGDNLTEDEKAALEEADKAIDELVEKLTEVAEEIKRVDEAVKSYDEETVKSTDSDELAQLKEDIQNLIDSTNTTENEKTALEDMIADVEGLEDKIAETEEKLEEIKGIENNFNPETVSSDDKAAIEDKIAEIEAVNPDNLTDEQKAEYEEIEAGFEALLDKIEEASKAVTDIAVELEMFDEERVTKFWEDDIEALKAKIDELLADENMGEAEKAKLNEYKAQAEKLIEIINTPKEYISCRFFYLIWDCLTWKYNGILWLFSKIFGC